MDLSARPHREAELLWLAGWLMADQEASQGLPAAAAAAVQAAVLAVSLQGQGKLVLAVSEGDLHLQRRSTSFLAPEVLALCAINERHSKSSSGYQPLEPYCSRQDPWSSRWYAGLVLMRSTPGRDPGSCGSSRLLRTAV